MRYLIAVVLCLMMGVGFGQAPVVGDYYGGGIVFWVNPDDNMQGLVCDIADLENANWGCEGESINGADDLGIGYGLANTIAIVNDCSENGIAAKLCSDYANYGFDDWYLPSINELEQIYLHKDIINSVSVELGGDTLIDHVSYDSENNWISDYYVSSTEWTSAWCYIFNFDQGIYQNGSKDGCDLCYHVRAVRSYSFVSLGCIDPIASNYDPDATEDDGSCCYAEWGDEWVQIGQDIDGVIAEDNFGSAVSISSNGNIVAMTEASNNGIAGKVRVYQNLNGNWMPLGAEISGLSSYDEFGYSISLNNSGDILAIGARSHNNATPYTIIYFWDGVNWNQMGSTIFGLFDTDFGASVSLSNDGLIIAIGAPQSDGNGNNSGQVSIYGFDGSSWNQLGQDIDGEAASDESGGSVTISSDGNTVAIGAWMNDGNGSQSGHVRIYNFSGTSWVQLGNDIDGESSDNWSGQPVSISADGNIVAIGAHNNNGNGTGYSTGHVRIYKFNGTSWVQIGNDIDGEAYLDQSGYSVSLSSDGETVAIGAPGNDGNGTQSGHVRVYNFNGTSWIQVGADIEGEAAGDESGRFRSLSLSSDGSTVAIGAQQNDGNGSSSGHVRVYEINTPCDVPGCTDPTALNYNPDATEDDGSCEYQKTYVPDDNFEQSLIDQGYDDVLDDYVLTQNINNVDFIDLSWSNISSLTGIEDFTMLSVLLCHHNEIDEISLCSNYALTYLRCNDNLISSIDLSQNLDLNFLRCNNNQLTHLDLTSNVNLTQLYSFSNSSLNCLQVWEIDYVYEQMEQNCIDPIDGGSLPCFQIDSGLNVSLDCNYEVQDDSSCSGVISTTCVASECCISGTQWDLNTMTCVYEDACSADIAKDGFVAVDDLLELLSAFGSSCDEVATGIGGEECVGAECCGDNTIWCETLEICIPFISCPADLNEDESVGSFDLLVFLPYYGGDCEDYESLPDCEDCIGEVDECGVCNGPGATEIVIESITILYDSLYAEQIDEWWVFEIGVDTTFVYECPPPIIPGCIDSSSCNYNPEATEDDGSCLSLDECGVCGGDGSTCGFQSCGDPISYQGYDYATVQIGEQCWFSENLNTSKYNNGDDIPNIQDGGEWSSLDQNETGAWAYYNNDSDYSSGGPSYTKLYNWYAVNDTRSLCPSGWHVPLDGDWTDLTDYLGGLEVAGEAMKADFGWGGESNSNSSGFSALPGGYITTDGDSQFDFYCHFWSSSSYDNSNSWYRFLTPNSDAIFRYPVQLLFGLSIRCVKD